MNTWWFMFRVIHFLLSVTAHVQGGGGGLDGNNNNNKCLSIVGPHLQGCSSYEEAEITQTPCSNIEVCKRTFNISYVKIEPYYHHSYLHLITHLLDHCCGNCTKLNTINMFEDMSWVTLASINSSHFVFPILGRSDSTGIYGFNFIPMLNVPSAFYITARRSSGEIVMRLLMACTNFWPLLTICLLMAFISGFIAWLCETWLNAEEFKRPFLIGIFDGFWWSFISMTTVGYGDKTPRSVLARLYSVIWILIGITICSMFTASLTTDLTTAISTPTPRISGSKVGVLKYRAYDASVVAKLGGIINETESVNAVTGVLEMITRLKNKSINGFLLDKHTFKYVYNHLLDISEVDGHAHTWHARYFINNTIRTETYYEEVPLSYGMLVKQRQDYEYFNQFIIDNQLHLETCKSLAINEYKEEIDSMANGLFSPSRGLFWPSLICTASVIIFILFFGLFFELTRKKLIKCCSCQYKEHERGLGANSILVAKK